MKVYLIADTHFNHGKIATYCQRPENFTELIIRNWRQTIQPTDLIIHLGDVFIGKADGWKEIYPQLPGRKMLIRGNHDRSHSITWWMDNGFDSACDGMMFRHTWLTHEPAKTLPDGAVFNVHGHLHNIWHGFHRNAEHDSPENQVFANKKLHNDWQRLFSVEYTNYRPVDFEKFLSKPDNFQARGPV